MSVEELLSEIRTLEGRRKKILAGLRFPTDGLPGSLAQSARRCGHPRCRCHHGDPHLSWTLTFMADGKKHVEHVPKELLETVRERVQEGNSYKSDYRCK